MGSRSETIHQNLFSLTNSLKLTEPWQPIRMPPWVNSGKRARDSPFQTSCDQCLAFIIWCYLSFDWSESALTCISWHNYSKSHCVSPNDNKFHGTVNGSHCHTIRCPFVYFDSPIETVHYIIYDTLAI